MTTPSEAAVEAAVGSLARSPGSFQRLVEDFVEIEFPTLFPWLTPRGRNRDDVAVKGWPDISCSANFSEATISTKWRAHLRSDIDRAAATPALSAFVFVCWGKEPKPAELSALLSEIAKRTRLPSTSVHLVFRERLCRSLRKPRFAKQWLELLHLPTSHYPFISINRLDVPGDPSNRLFGASEGEVSFLPTRAEYRDGKVHRPRSLEAVALRLKEQEHAFVRGRGASGKSTLAMSLAFMMPYASGAVYYLDITEVVGSSSAALQPAIDALAAFGDRNVLFIIDNVHHNEAFAATILSTWREMENGSRLLLLARQRGNYPDPRQNPAVLNDASHIELAADPEDILGVYRRVVRVPSATQDPPAHRVQEWFELFQGDLVAFSAAAHRQRQALLRGRWSLGPEDSADYVRSAYLSHLAESEYQNLLRLSLTFVLERPLPADALTGVGFEISIQRGVVHETYLSRRTGRRAYALVHSGIGRLILAAAGIVDPQPLRRELAAHSPQLGLFFAARLQSDGREQEAQELYAQVWDASNWPLHVQNLDVLSANFDQLSQYNAITEQDICHRIIQDQKELSHILASTAISNLVALTERLRNAQSNMYELVRDSLNNNYTLDCFVDALERSPPHLALNFMSLLRQDPVLVDKSYYVASKLYAPKFTERMAASLHAADLSLLVGLVRYLWGYDRKAYRELYRYLTTPESLSTCVEKTYRTSPQGFLAFLRERRLAKLVLPRIDLPRWEEAHSGKVAWPDFVGSLETALSFVGAEFLAQAPACALIRNPMPARWSPRHISFPQAQAAIRLAASEPPNILATFVAEALVGSGFVARCTATETYWLCSHTILHSLHFGVDPKKTLAEGELLAAAIPAAAKAGGDIANQSAALILLGVSDWAQDDGIDGPPLPLVREFWLDIFDLLPGLFFGQHQQLDIAFLLRGAIRANSAWRNRSLGERAAKLIVKMRHCTCADDISQLVIEILAV